MDIAGCRGAGVIVSGRTLVALWGSLAFFADLCYGTIAFLVLPDNGMRRNANQGGADEKDRD